MEKTFHILCALVIGFGLASPLEAEPVRRSPKASVVSPVDSTSDLNVVREEQDLEFIAGAFLGISNDGRSGGLAAGFSGELLIYRYLGVDLFGFHDLLQGPGDVLFSETPTPGEKLQYGAFITPKLRLPFTVGSIRLVPHIGAGLGTRGGLDVRFNGATAVAGLQFQFMQIGVLDVTYMAGIAGRTKRLLNGSNADEEIAVNADADTFNRFGIGFTVQATSSVGFGAQFIRSQIQGINRSLTLLRGTYRF